MSKQKQVTTFTFMQKLKEEYWNWSEDEFKKHFVDSDAVLEHVYNRIIAGLKNVGESGKGLEIEFSGILHDRDFELLGVPGESEKIIEPIEPHVHGVVTLPRKRDINVVANWIGVEPQYIEAPKKGRYGKENLLAYLIHAKENNKTHYRPEDVRTFDTWDYVRYCQKKSESWERYRATRKVESNKASADWLVKQVQQGRLTKKDIMRNDEYADIYADNMRLINDGFQFYGERKGYETLEALENGEFELSVYFITGKPRSGKTTFALELIKELLSQEGHENWGVYQTPPTNPMDDYHSEEIVLMDDFRPQSLDATAWLQMFDGRTSANMSARYKNKQKAYRVLIITSYMEPYEFFSYVKGTGGTNEALEQFIGRLLYNVRVFVADDRGRYIMIEQIAQGGEPKYYDLKHKIWLPETHASIQYAKSMGELGGQYRSTRFYGEPITIGSQVEALDFLVEDIKKRNDPALDHTYTERPKVEDVRDKVGENLLLEFEENLADK